jgi:heme oxygenase
MAVTTSATPVLPATDATESGGERFSTALRLTTQDVHEEAENVGFVQRLMAGHVVREGYTAMAGQLSFVYAALEERARALASDPVVAAFLDPRLDRLPSIEADLRFLIGSHWREDLTPLPATARYVERIEAIEWSGHFVAHHYTRYLGDLSGGQIISRLLSRTYGLTEGGDGLRFYHFADIRKSKPFKDDYRRALDSAPWSEQERESVIAEARTAFELNAALTVDLGRLFPA